MKEEAVRYKKATKKEKSYMLDEFVKLTGYSRCYASYVLRTYGKKVAVDSKDGKRTVFIGDDLYRNGYEDMYFVEADLVGHEGMNLRGE